MVVRKCISSPHIGGQVYYLPTYIHVILYYHNALVVLMKIYVLLDTQVRSVKLAIIKNFMEEMSIVNAAIVMIQNGRGHK